MSSDDSPFTEKEKEMIIAPARTTSMSCILYQALASEEKTSVILRNDILDQVLTEYLGASVRIMKISSIATLQFDGALMLERTRALWFKEILPRIRIRVVQRFIASKPDPWQYLLNHRALVLSSSRPVECKVAILISS